MTMWTTRAYAASVWSPTPPPSRTPARGARPARHAATHATRFPLNLATDAVLHAWGSPAVQSAESEKLQEHEFENINDEIHELNVHQPNNINNNVNSHKLMITNVMLKPAAVPTRHLHVRPFRPSSTTTIDSRVTTMAAQ